MASRYPSSTPSTLGTCIGADDFVQMLRHLAEAYAQESSGRVRNMHHMKAVGSHRKPPVSFWRTLPSRLECVVQDFRDWVGSTSMLLCILVSKLVLRVILLSQNGCGCSWCGSGRSRSDGRVTTLASLHWSFTNMIVQLQGLRVEKTVRQEAVADFLGKHRISVQLSARVKKYIGSSQPQQITESNFKDLQKLSTELLVELHEEMRAPEVLPFHPFFLNLRQRHPHLVRELCLDALVPLLKFSDQVVFSAGEECRQMYFIANGSLQYTVNQPRETDPNRQLEVVRRMLYGGQSLSEAALWTSWVHRGELRVVINSLLLALDASGFAKVISGEKGAHMLAASYARKFVESLNRGPDLTDPATMQAVATVDRG